MNGVSGGKISFITNINNGTYQYITTIDDNPSIFSLNNNGIEFISYYGININKNITNENGGILLFEFLNAPMSILSDVNIISSSHEKFDLYSGNTIKCLSNSNGINMIGLSSYGSTLDSTSCKIITNNESNNDIIWFHTNSINSNIFLGGNDTISYSNYSLSNNEINLINSSNSATIYIGDKYNNISETNNIYISNLNTV